MSQALADELGLPPIDQVGYVVRDIDRAVEIYGGIFGEFTRMDSATPGTLYRGERSDVTLKMAFGRSGPIEIELIEWVSGKSPHKEMLDTRGEGVHHVRFRVDDISGYRKKLEERGFLVVWSHSMPELKAEWAYLEGPEGRGGAMIELFAMPG